MNRGLLIPNMLFCVCEYGTIIMLFIDENGPNNVIVSQKCFTEDHVCFNPPSPLAIPAYADMLKGRFKFINVRIFIFTNVPNFQYYKINISINYSFIIEIFKQYWQLSYQVFFLSTKSKLCCSIMRQLF